MRTLMLMCLACGLLAAGTLALAQRPGGLREGPSGSADDFVTRMMAFDKDRDGKLTKDELGDERLYRLFDRADADKDGFVTKDELSALAAKELANDRRGPGGFGPPGGGGPGGPRMMPPRPGEVLPAMLRQRLDLTDEQAKQLDALQKDVDARLESILNDEQKEQLRAMRDRGPGGFGPPGGGPPPPPPGPPR
jgi:hypothetical protein